MAAIARRAPRAALLLAAAALLLPTLLRGAAAGSVSDDALKTNFGLYYASKEATAGGTRYCLGLTKAAARGAAGAACDPAASKCCSSGAADGPQSVASLFLGAGAPRGGRSGEGSWDSLMPPHAVAWGSPHRARL
jgi:hypothetical protein